MSQRIVGDDAGEPGGERGSAGEAPDRRERLEIGALHRVLGILAIAQYPPCGAKQALIVAPHDEAHRSGVATRDIGRKLEVGAALVAKFGERVHLAPPSRATERTTARALGKIPILQLSIGTIGRKDTEAAGTADRNSNDLVTSFDRKTHGHDCLQCNRRLADEAAVEPTRPHRAGIKPARSIHSWKVAKAWCRNSDREMSRRGEWRPKPPLVDYRARRPRAWERAVLLPGWISERRAFEKLTIAPSTWFRSPGSSRLVFILYLDPSLKTFLAPHLIYLLFYYGK